MQADETPEGLRACYLPLNLEISPTKTLVALVLPLCFVSLIWDVYPALLVRSAGKEVMAAGRGTKRSHASAH